MKKIVGIIGAVAMATSLFAADVSAGTKINGKLFNYGADEKLQLFSENNDSHDYANPNFVFGIAGDKDVLGWIKEGNEAWLGEVLQDPAVLGYQATDALVRVLVNGEELPDNYELPQPEVISPENVSEYDFENWRWLG